MPIARDKVLYVLTGPTAVGKTELALAWAEESDAEIVSCDSLLFYRGMDIGTAKPTRDELRRVRHHLIDVCQVNERMDVVRYVELVRAALTDITSRGRRVLVTGGSGFYLKAFFAPVADEIQVSPALREEISLRLEKAGLDALVHDLRQLEPRADELIDTANPRRVVRALERCRATGRRLEELMAEFSRTPPPFSDWAVELVRLDRAPGELQVRLESRVKRMIEDGLVEEVRRLLPLGLKENPSAAKAIGYRETVEMLEGRLTLAELPDAIVKNTRALVKKQRTWFRTQLPPHRVINLTEDPRPNLWPISDDSTTAQG
jgi:tRNA dimethylallyltransferase